MNEFLIVVMFILSWILYSLARREAIFVPLPIGTVRKMLKLAGIKKSDVLYDLGSGDGRVVAEAVNLYGVRSIGIERSRFLCWLARLKIKNLKGRAKIIHGNLLEGDISKASVIIVYLTQKMNDRLEPKLLKELKRGTRIVSADHGFKSMKELAREKAGHFCIRLYKV